MPGPPESDLARVCARKLALGHLAEARDARRSLKKVYEPEGLHDLRVSLRRLRVALKAYRPYLGRAGSSKILRDLARLIRPTGRLRDLDVAATALRRLRPPARGAVARRVETERRTLIRALNARILPGLKDAGRRLIKRLREPPSGKGRPISWDDAWQLAVLDARNRLTRRGRETGKGELEQAHRVRIAAKALRYLLEPFEKKRPGADKELLKARHLQDRLGRERDLRMLRELGIPAPRICRGSG